MKKILILIIFIPFWSVAQNHDYHWVFGYNNANNNDTTTVIGGMFMDFGQLPARTYKKNIGLDFRLFCAACSDSLGNLIYYSNGIRIFNKNHQLMENGDTINPGTIWISSQTEGYPNVIGGLSIPKPGASNQYYLIHLAELFNTGLFFTPLYYTLIDMNANGGDGLVMEKNKILMEGNITWPAMVKHANGRDWWLLVGQQNSPVMYRFLFSPNGIEGPWEQSTSLLFQEEDGPSNCLFSPDGTWYLRCDATNGLNLFSFNRCTGELSNHQFLPKIPGYFVASGSASFSANSRYLYVSDNRATMIQFDLDPGKLSFASMDTIQHYDLFADPAPPILARYFFRQLGPDGKHYMSTSGTTSYMHVIHRPDLPAPLCDVENHGLKLPRYNARTVCYFPNYRLGAWDGSPCDTLEVQNPPNGFYKTEYEAFLEREAQHHKITTGEFQAVNPRGQSLLVSPQDKNAPDNPINIKDIIFYELEQRGFIKNANSKQNNDHERD